MTAVMITAQEQESVYLQGETAVTISSSCHQYRTIPSSIQLASLVRVFLSQAATDTKTPPSSSRILTHYKSVDMYFYALMDAKREPSPRKTPRTPIETVYADEECESPTCSESRNCSPGTEVEYHTLVSSSPQQLFTLGLTVSS